MRSSLPTYETENFSNDPKYYRRAESSASESDTEGDLEGALAALQASGQNFLQSFEVKPFVPPSSSKTARGRAKSPPALFLDEDGWRGIEESAADDVDPFHATLFKKRRTDKMTVRDQLASRSDAY